MVELGFLIQEIRGIDAGARALRSFGLVVGSVFVGIAALLYWRADWTVTTACGWLLGIGGVLIVAGGVLPGSLKYVYKLWMGAALILGFIMTRVLLTAVFFLAVTPTGLIQRALGKDLLDRKIEPTRRTYWRRKVYDDDSPRRLERYF